MTDQKLKVWKFVGINMVGSHSYWIVDGPDYGVEKFNFVKKDDFDKLKKENAKLRADNERLRGLVIYCGDKFYSKRYYALAGEIQDKLNGVKALRGADETNSTYKIVSEGEASKLIGETLSKGDMGEP